MLVSCQFFTFPSLLMIIYVCVYVPLQIHRWHIDLEPWAGESHSLEEEATRFLNYITTPQVSHRPVNSHWLFKLVLTVYLFKQAMFSSKVPCTILKINVEIGGGQMQI